LALLCREVAREPALLPLFVRIVALVPQTSMELKLEERRLAASVGPRIRPQSGCGC
jgi:hypothetical protein